jgi:L-fuconolactonase
MMLIDANALHVLLAFIGVYSRLIKNGHCRLSLPLGSVNTPDDEIEPYEIRRKVFALSRFPNVYIKIHGLSEFCKKMKSISEPFPFEIHIPAVLEMSYEAFGPERMMWGSDYPPVSGREGYGNSLRLTLEQFASRTQEDGDMIFGKVARNVFGI